MNSPLPPHDRYLSNDIAFLRQQNKNKPTRQPEKLISAYVNGRRIMPSSSPFPGVYDINKTPYIIELCDNMSPYSSVQGVAVKKGVQIAITTAAENILAYGIGERPCDQMYLTGTEDLIKKFNLKRLTPLIESCGFQDLLGIQNSNPKSRQSGDTITTKAYPGGSLILGSIQSPAHARSDSVKIMIIDEIDLVDTQMSSGEGNILKVLDGRLIAFGDRAKSFSLSTPRVWGNSLIDIQYNRGDKRKFMVPCPICLKKQWLCMGNEKSNYGLKGVYVAGRLDQGYYQCYHCREAIFDYNKEFMLKNGVWEPTTTAMVKNYRSYHIPSFYSPPAMMSFTKMRQEYDEAQVEGDDGMRSFTNLYLGKSFKPSGERPKFESVIELRAKYPSGEVPDGIMFLTAAVDVQQGIQKYNDMTNAEILKEVAKLEKKKDDIALKKVPRVEIEICGHGQDFRTASIMRKLIFGRIDDNTAGAWEALADYAKETDNFRFKRKDKYKFQPKMIFIDSGYGKYTDVVYNFCDSWPGTFAIKGTQTPKRDKLKNFDIDEMKNGNIMNFKFSESGSHALVLINTNYYKSWIYKNMKNKVCPVNGQPPQSHQTPGDYPDYYFHELRAEEHKKDGSFHNISQRNNEALDLLVYNKCAADFFIDGLVEAERKVLKKKYPRITKDELRNKVNRTTVTNKYKTVLIKKGW